MSGETAQMKQARDGAEKRSNANSDAVEGGWPALDGVPMVKISWAASELIATQNYSNITVGPASVTRFVADLGPEQLYDELTQTRKLIEAAVAEERETIASLARANIAAQSQPQRA